jgi:hypothetical protein
MCQSLTAFEGLSIVNLSMHSLLKITQVGGMAFVCGNRILAVDPVMIKPFL